MNKNFDITGLETFTDGCDEHRILDVRFFFEKNILTIKFNKKDYILAIYLFYSTMENNYAFDPEWKLFLNNTEFVYNYDNLIKLLNFDFQQINEFKIKYSNTESGSNAYTVAKQLLWFPITEWKSDNYYFEKELKRWDKVNSSKINKKN